MHRFIWLLLSITGCTQVERGSLTDAKIYAIGDSIFEWNLSDQLSAPQEVGRILNQPVYNAAISGSQMTDDSESSIPNQYVSGEWDWIVMDGGANDLNNLCECDDCSTVQDQIESELTTFVTDRRSEDINIVIWGYYDLPSNARYGFDRCSDSLAELRQRQKALADTDPGILFVDGSLDITGEDLTFFDRDKVHPSTEGSTLIGSQIAQAIQDAQ